jgi:hypothetical protein
LKRRKSAFLLVGHGPTGQCLANAGPICLSRGKRLPAAHLISGLTGFRSLGGRIAELPSLTFSPAVYAD